VETVKRNICALYGSGNAADAPAAGAWLQQWQAQEGSYDVAAALLVDEDLTQPKAPMTLAQTLPMLFFAAQTILVQSQRQWKGYVVAQSEQVSDDARHRTEAEVRREDDLFERALHIVARCPSGSIVHSKVAHAIAAQMLRSARPLAQRITALQQVAGNSLQHTLVVLYVFLHLPEELDRAPFHPVTRSTHCEVLEGFGAPLLTFLEHVLREAAIPPAAKAQALACALSWVTWIIGSSEVVEHNLFQGILAGLGNSEQFKNARELLIEILNHPVGTAKFEGVAGLLLQRFEGPCPAGVPAEEWSAAKSWVLSTFCEANALDMVKHREAGGRLAVILLDVLTTAPLLVASATFEVFKKLACSKTELWVAELLQAVVPRVLQRICAYPPEMPAELVKMVPALGFMELLQVPVQLGVLEDLTEDYRTFRSRAMDLFSYAARLLGSVYISILHDLYMKHREWMVAEAVVVALRPVCRLVQAFDPNLLQQLVTVLAADSKTSCGTILMIGDYSRWLREQEALLQLALEVVMGAFNKPGGNSPTTICAADAFLHLTQHAGKQLAANHTVTNTVLQTTIEALPTFHPKSQVVVAQALAILGACVEPISHARAIFVGLVQASVYRLTSVQGQVKTAELHDVTISSLDCLTEYYCVIGKHESPEAPDIVRETWDIAWPAVVGVLQTCSAEDILKRACRTIEEAMVYGQQAVHAKRTEAMSACLQLFLRTSLPCFIWALNMCMRTVPVNDHTQYMERCGFAMQEVSRKCSTSPSAEVVGPFLNMLLEYNSRFVGAFWTTWGDAVNGILQLAIGVISYPQRDVRRAGIQFLAQAVSTVPQGASVPLGDAIMDVCIKCICDIFEQNLARCMADLLFEVVQRTPAQAICQAVVTLLQKYHGSAWAESEDPGQAKAEAGVVQAARALVSVRQRMRFRSLVADISRISGKAMTVDALVAYDFVEDTSAPPRRRHL